MDWSFDTTPIIWILIKNYLKSPGKFIRGEGFTIKSQEMFLQLNTGRKKNELSKLARSIALNENDTICLLEIRLDRGMDRMDL